MERGHRKAGVNESRTSSNYITIKTGGQGIYYSPSVAWDGTFYLRCEQAGQVAEIEYWR